MGSGRLNTKGQGFLHVANPASIRGHPTSVVGSTFIPLVFDPEAKVGNIPVRFLDRLHYGRALGTSLFPRNTSNISDGKHGEFHPSPNAPWIHFCPSQKPHRSPRGAVRTAGIHSHGSNYCVGRWDRFFCAVTPAQDNHDSIEDWWINDAEKPNRALQSCVVRRWDPVGKLQLAQPASRKDFVRAQIPDIVRGPEPQHRQVVLIKRTQSFDLSASAEGGAAWGAPWWELGTPIAV